MDPINISDIFIKDNKTFKNKHVQSQLVKELKTEMRGLFRSYIVFTMVIWSSKLTIYKENQHFGVAYFSSNYTLHLNYCIYNFNLFIILFKSLIS
jgi:hypothetical protein